MSDSTARGPRYTIHDGFRMPMGFPVAGFESGQRYRASPGDVFVASYPKCGTTWTQYIVYLLENDGRPLAAGQRLDTVFPHLEEVGEDIVRALPSPRLIKTHLPYERTPWSAQAKYVFIARNPFDCAVSFYHHTRGFPRHYDFARGSWDTYFECFLRGEVDFGDYFEHLKSWWPHRAEPNLLFLSYERMVEEPAAATRAIAGLLGGRASELTRDARRLDGMVRDSGFDEMRAARTAGRALVRPTCRHSCAKASSAIGAINSRPNRRGGSPRSAWASAQSRSSGPDSSQTR